MTKTTEERKVLKDVESIMNSGKTYSGKLRDVLKSLLSFFVSQEKYRVVKGLIELLQPLPDEPKVEKVTIRQRAKPRRRPKKHSKEKLPSVTVSYWLNKWGAQHGYIYYNAVFNKKYGILEKGFERVKLNYEERENSYIVDMLFAHDGEDGMGRKDHVYDLSHNKEGKSFKVNCTKFLNDYGLIEKYQKLGTGDRGKPRNRFFVKRLAKDQFFFTIPKVYKSL